MGLHFQVDVSPAEWIVRSKTPEDLKITWGPEGFDAYARLRYIPDPLRPGQDEADSMLPDDHMGDQAQARRTIKLLSSYT